MWYHNYPFDQGEHILLLRHAERPPFQAGSFGHDSRLTEKGREDSVKVGEILGKFRWGEIHSSPLIRCEETAQCFLKGAQQELSIQFSTFLGNPGVFVSDPTLAGPYFLANSIQESLEKMLLAEHIPGVRSLKEGAHLFINYLKTIQIFPCLMITHDVIIALLKSYFFDVPPQIPLFLDGFSLQLEEVI
jgi:phosphohistidine phosphatase SixA